MKIALISNSQFPEGMAGTNRVHSFVKGINSYSENDIHIFSSKEKSGNETNFSEISYHFVKEYTAQSKLGRRFRRYHQLYRLVLEENEVGKFDLVLVIAGDGLFINILSSIIAKKIDVRIIFERSEYPSWILKKGTLSMISRLNLLSYRFADGFISISEELVSFYKDNLRNKVRMLKVPILVDFDFFSAKSIKRGVNYEEKYFLYAGSLRGTKDSVEDIIEAFSIYSKRNLEIKLFLTGEKPEGGKLQVLLERHKIENRVTFLGKIPRNDLPGLFQNSKALLLAKRENLQNKGNFPTKVGEYLASGRPVIATALGELKNYLIDEENSFLFNPGDVKGFVDKMIMVENEALATKIGNNGKTLANEHFNYVAQGKRIYCFLLQVMG